MKARPWLLAGAFVGVLASGATVTYWTRWSLVVLAASVVFGWIVSRRCAHRHATLLPPVRNAGPDRDHARWYCDRCGHTWDAGLESSTRPRVIFDGYDESKAVQAAARADSLDKQRRRLATQRAGGTATRAAKPAAPPRPGPRPVQALLDQRAVGYPDDSRPFVAARSALKQGRTS